MNPTCYSDLQLKNDWTEQGDSQGTHGQCSIVPSTGGYVPMTVHFSPAARPPGQPYDNAYVLHRNAPSGARQWAYIVSVRFPSPADVTNCEAFEMDFQKNDGPYILNCGWQFLFGTGVRIWNRSQKAWTKTPVLPMPSSLPQCLPTRIVSLFSHGENTVTYLGMSFNGVWTPLNISYPAVQESQERYVNNAVQADSKGKGAPISFEVHECSVVGF